MPVSTANCACCGGQCNCTGVGTQCSYVSGSLCPCGTSACPWCQSTCCPCITTNCCPNNPIPTILNVNCTFNGPSCTLAGFTFQIQYFSAGTGPYGAIYPFTLQGYWYGCTTWPGLGPPGCAMWVLITCEGGGPNIGIYGNCCEPSPCSPPYPLPNPFYMTPQCNPFELDISTGFACGGPECVEAVTIMEP